MEKGPLYCQMEQNTLVNGRMAKFMAKELWNGQMEVGMRVNGKMVKDMAKVLCVFRMIISTLVNGKMINAMEKEFLPTALMNFRFGKMI